MIRTPPASKEYKDGWDRIFGQKTRTPEGGDVGQDSRPEPREQQEGGEQSRTKHKPYCLLLDPEEPVAECTCGAEDGPR